ncbi:MAG TPA: cytochrome C oxidase subunit II [Myxococcota bacterium]|nr:cytochrome C oxidase subunit II [Myxococcota bacterium]
MIESLIPSGSSFSGDIDSLFILITVVVGFWFLATMGMFLWLTIRFRAKEGVPAQYITGKEPHLKSWITIPHALIILCDVFLIAGAVRVWFNVKQWMPSEDVEPIGVIGQQWAWTFVHAGPDGVLDTADDVALIDEMHVQTGKNYAFRLESKDVLHSFSVPVFRLKQDVVPGRVILGWFQPTLAGEFDIQCAEICGIGHGIMGARVIVETPEQHKQWMESVSPTGVASL